MRQIYMFAMVLVGLAALYALFRVVTFTPDPLAPLVFEEPAPEAVATNLTVNVSGGEAAVLSDDEMLSTQAAVDEISADLRLYQESWANASAQLKGFGAQLFSVMAKGALPTRFASKATPDGLRSINVLNMNVSSPLQLQAGGMGGVCDVARPSSAIVGTPEADSIDCQVITQNDRVVATGPGNDKITLGDGNAIISAGSGDDEIKAGGGAFIVLLEPNWGKDKLDVDCTGATLQDNEKLTAAQPWVYKNINFIVLADSLNPADLSWEGNVLKSRGGDSLTVTSNCFNVVPALEVVQP